MSRELDMKTIPQFFLHQHVTEKHLTQSIKQGGEEKNKNMFYIESFNENHVSKVKFT
jgi:hypothetical protein